MNNTIDLRKLLANYGSFKTVIEEYDINYDLGVHQVALIESFDLLHETAINVIKQHLQILGLVIPDEELELFELAGENEVLGGNTSTWLDSVKHKVSVSEKNDDHLLFELLAYIRNQFFYAVQDLIDNYKQ